LYFHESRGAWLPALAGLLLLDSPLAAAQQQDSLGILETYVASSFNRQIGRRINFICPAVTKPSTDIWGTDVYATDSAICSAAIHAGVLALGEAGPVSIVMGPEVATVQGSTRNGVTTQSYGNAVYSFTFVKPEPPAAIDWVTNALGLPRDYKPTITVICPPGGNADAFIWGTDTYIVDSAVCVAAVHAGVIGFGGGAVAVTKVPGLQPYVATVRNGVSSISWSAGDYDAYIVAPGVAGPAPATQSDGRRVIRTAGYTAAGNAVDISPRTIRTAGYEGTGTGADIVPRVIRTPGWTAMGGAP
jgi:hypothetical protein